jgi:hypothetical protein
MVKVRGYVDSLLIQRAIAVCPELANLPSTTGQIEAVFAKFLALTEHKKAKV